MMRCLQLARLGAGAVAPNPMVGAVLVCGNRIIGEGYHEQYGGPHAEVNCLDSVDRNDRHLAGQSILYVSLEPCAHYGKTPPCTSLIINTGIPKVVIGCRDVYREVAGRGIEQLRRAGIDVTEGILADESRALNRRFFTYHTEFRPYIVLKWAQSVNGMIGTAGSVTRISHPATDRLVHKWRSEEMAILVGTRTALNDDPSLTTRLWEGKHPVRIILDRQLRLPRELKVFTDGGDTLVFNSHLQETRGNVRYIKTASSGMLEEMLRVLFERNIHSVLVEGGRATLQSFIDAGWWDEARVVTNEELALEPGIPAPGLTHFTGTGTQQLGGDVVRYYERKKGA